MSFLTLSFFQVVAQGAAIHTTPVGYCSIEIAAGSGDSKRNSLISIPLLGIDPSLPSRGTVTAVKSSRTIEATPLDKGSDGQDSWPEGGLSVPEDPYLLQMTSGAAEGRMFLISTSNPNTESDITLTDPHVEALDLFAEGVVAGDRFRIFACDTLSSFFGRPEDSGVQGGATSREADTVVILNNGAASTYFYSTKLNRWTRVGLGSPDASHTPLLPYYGVQYSRIAPTPLKLISLGEVPVGKRKMHIRKAGSTILSTYWPSGHKLMQTGVQNTRGWVSQSPTKVGDRLTLTASGVVTTHRHDGASWRRVSFGSPLSDETILPPGGAGMILRQGDGSSNPVYLLQDSPYAF
jgi:hypothetical protein